MNGGIRSLAGTAGLFALVACSGGDRPAPVSSPGAALSQVETNVDVPAAAFTVEEQKDLTPLTMEELRKAGPLRGQ